MAARTHSFPLEGWSFYNSWPLYLLEYPFYESLERIHEANAVLFCISEPLCTDEMKWFKSSYHNLLVKSVKYMKFMLWSGEV